MKEPIDVPTRETVAFLVSHLHSGATLLEVGCGAGHVAAELLRLGYRVTGLDSEREMITQAQARGVPTVQTSWPAFDSAPVDAIAFTRSLHHIHPLRPALEKARVLLKPTGIFLLEDFAFDETDEVTIRWFLEIVSSQAGQRLINPLPGAFITSLLGSKDPVAFWHGGHDHELHSIATMTQAINDYFVIEESQTVPYLYRYLVPVLPKTSEAAAFVEEVFQEETRLGEQGEIALIGRRLVGSPQEGSGV
jgi:SAM-dependent methyltransferase